MPPRPEVRAMILHRSFYEASAQIIPVLLLVAFVGEGRIVRSDQVDPRDRQNFAIFGIGAMLVMVLGELAALRTLGQGHDSVLLRGLTSLALVYGFLFVLAQGARLLLISQPDALSRKRLEASARPLLFALAFLTVGSLEIIDPGFPGF
jgi:hypothetical protein